MLFQQRISRDPSTEFEQIESLRLTELELSSSSPRAGREEYMTGGKGTNAGPHVSKFHKPLIASAAISKLLFF